MYGNSSVLAWISWPPKNVSYVWRYGGYRENMNELMNVVNWAVPRSRSVTIAIITFYTDANQLPNPCTIICSKCLKIQSPKQLFLATAYKLFISFCHESQRFSASFFFFKLTVRMSTSGKNTSPDTCFRNKCTENIVCNPLHKLQEVGNTDKIMQFQVCGNKGCKSNL